MVKRGYFFTFEGVEGAGKSSVLTAVAERLRERNHSVVITRQPGGTELGQNIRSMLMAKRERPMATWAELFLFAADRAQHVSEIIRPSIEQGKIVLCDRYTHSSLAYQGYAGGIPLEELRHINLMATGGIVPDTVLLLDLDPTVGLERVQRRSQETGIANTSFDDEKLEFHRLVRKGYLELAREEESHFAIIDASKPLESSVARCLELIEQKLSAKT